MNKQLKRIIGSILCAALMTSVFAGCGQKADNGKTEDGKILLRVGDWPDPETKPEQYERNMKTLEEFEKKYPDVHIEPDTWTFDVKSYAAKAEGGTLPTVYYVPLTEAKNIMDMEYAADITDEMKSRGYYDHINDFMLANISRDKKIYFFTESLYDVGLFVNIDLLNQAGYVEEDGTPHQPKDWYELAEMAQKIKEVTGKSGYIIPTMSNAGGWRFTPLAWSFGTDFMEKDKDGKWYSTFDTQECIDALQFIKDLKWKYDVLPANTLIDNAEMRKQLGLGEAAMGLAENDSINRMAEYGLPIENVGLVQIPAGPKRHVTLMGGGYKVFNKDATPEQIKAAFDWLEFNGSGRELTEDSKQSIQDRINVLKAKNMVVGIRGVSPWNSEDEVTAYTDEQYKEQANINLNHIRLYNDKEGVEFQEEEPIDAQSLYAILDTCIQEVLNNKDADCAELIKKAAADFQSNNLDYAD